MVTILAWTVLILMVVLPLGRSLLALRRERRRQNPPPADRLTYATLIKLHDVRQRLNVRQYRSEVKQEGARTRRALQAELAEWEQWESEA